ncbi:hypothetical protein EVAR_11659_1 [Eumeta japonica]|uniref:Uncharacterized protein n=1 Tax=Eumeta variegata TaxID=151549 RepID=A0A4C1U5L1_EUMVA|nr:hypothetical protein EVAR_11659_1 [Eumeta japonica]
MEASWGARTSFNGAHEDTYFVSVSEGKSAKLIDLPVSVWLSSTCQLHPSLALVFPRIRISIKPRSLSIEPIVTEYSSCTFMALINRVSHGTCQIFQTSVGMIAIRSSYTTVVDTSVSKDTVVKSSAAARPRVKYELRGAQLAVRPAAPRCGPAEVITAINQIAREAHTAPPPPRRRTGRTTCVYASEVLNVLCLTNRFFVIAD